VAASSDCATMAGGCHTTGSTEAGLQQHNLSAACAPLLRCSASHGICYAAICWNQLHAVPHAAAPAGCPWLHCLAALPTRCLLLPLLPVAWPVLLRRYL